MTLSRRLATVLLGLLAATIALLAASGGAQRADAGSPAPKTVELATSELTADGVATGACHTSWRAGETGVATDTVAVPGLGEVLARLDASGGDWDLALFDATGRQVGGGATTAADEVASGYVVQAGELRVQACRRSADAARTARVAIDHTGIDTSSEPEKIKLVSVKTPTRAAKARLTALGLDMTEHGGKRSLGVVLHGEDDAATLRRAGFEWDVQVADLVARTVRDRQRDARFAARTRRSNLPSGRDTYRTLADYENEMKTLAQQNPGLVKVFEMPNKTWLGRTVMGVEITTDVNVNNGKPAFFNMGLHHAREWPSGEHALEWAYELVNSYKAGDQRARRIVEGTRNIVVPVVNPDGYNASYEAGALQGAGGGRDESAPDTAYFGAGALSGGEYRRKNCRLPDDSEAGNCASSAGLAESGVDPNRNYGGLWGGPGASTNPFTQSYRGPGPFSEPETQNIQWKVQREHVTTLVTNHTTAGLVLRAPGVAALGDPVDEHRGYKALGDDMGAHNGYFSQKGFELYDTTGTTEDWSYNNTGGFGFTFEIYCGDPNYETGDCDDPAFHPLYETMIKEWDGTSDQANHVEDPGPLAGFDGRGNREAYYIAAESTLNAARHSVFEGEAPAGVRLRLAKTFKTQTWPQPQEEGDPKPIVFTERVDTVYDVGRDGRVEWHVNPSTRPIVAKSSGRNAEGPPSPPREDLDGSVADAPVPCPSYFEAGACPPGGSWVDHPFEFPVGGGVDNESATLRFEFPEVDDWDLEVYEDKNENGISDPDDGAPVANSGNGAFSGEFGYEETSIQRPTSGETTKYVARMINFAASGSYDGKLTFNGPLPFRGAQREEYTLTCEKDGQVLQTSQVFIERGERRTLDLAPCRRALERPQPAPQPEPPTGERCVPSRGFSKATARGRGRRVRFAFARRVRRPVRVDVFQQSIGRRVVGERLVARYRKRTRSFTWKGKANRPGRKVRNGWYFVRYRMKLANGREDVRRVTLQRRNGKFKRRKSFYRRATCGVLRSYKLTRPVFGGRTNRALYASFRLSQAARVKVDVLRGKKVVRTFRARNRRPGTTYRLRQDAERLRRGTYKFRVTVTSGGKTARSTLRSRRL